MMALFGEEEGLRGVPLLKKVWGCFKRLVTFQVSSQCCLFVGLCVSVSAVAAAAYVHTAIIVYYHSRTLNSKQILSSLSCLDCFVTAIETQLITLIVAKS